MANGFRMPVEDLFYITGRGYVMTGKVQSGVIAVGDPVTIESPSHSVTTRVIGIEMIQKLLTKAQPGDNIGILVQRFDADAISDGVELLSKNVYRLISLTLADPLPLSKPPRVQPTWWKFWKR